MTTLDKTISPETTRIQSLVYTPITTLERIQNIAGFPKASMKRD